MTLSNKIRTQNKSKTENKIYTSQSEKQDQKSSRESIIYTGIVIGLKFQNFTRSYATETTVAAQAQRSRSRSKKITGPLYRDSAYFEKRSLPRQSIATLVSHSLSPSLLETPDARKSTCRDYKIGYFRDRRDQSDNM
eukprot:Awhi_evm1s15173